MAKEKFFVCLTRMVEQTAKVEVEAESEEQARELGRAKLSDDTVVWHEGDTVNDEGVYAVLDAQNELVWERTC